MITTNKDKLRKLGKIVANFQQKCVSAFKRLSKQCPLRSDRKIGHGSHHEYVLCNHTDRQQSMFIEHCKIDHCPFVNEENSHDNDE